MSKVLKNLDNILNVLKNYDKHIITIGLLIVFHSSFLLKYKDMLQALLSFSMIKLLNNFQNA